MTVNPKRRFGWRPDFPDQSDEVFSLHEGVKAKEQPSRVDFRLSMPLIYDQGNVGSCTAQAVCACVQTLRMARTDAINWVPSRLFVYYNTRLLEGTVKYDAGATLRETIKAVSANGVCDEKLWEYNPRAFRLEPSKDAYEAALSALVVKYERIPRDLIAMKECLIQGFPFAFGFSVYGSFESAEVKKTGIVPMPTQAEGVLGGHAVVAVGYDDTKRCFIVRNSWGEKWGDCGHCYMPYEYLLNNQLSRDFWAVTEVKIK